MQGVKKNNVLATLAERTLKDKLSNDVMVTGPHEGKSTARFTPPITRSFPHRYGRGKVLQIENQPENPETTTEEEEDAEQSDHELAPDYDTNLRVNIDEVPEIVETVPMDEMNLSNQAADTTREQVQDFEKLGRVMDRDNQEPMSLEENHIQVYNNTLLEPTSNHTMPVGDSSAITVATNTFPPPVNIAQHEGVEKAVENTSMETEIDATGGRVLGGTASFHGYNVPLHLIPSLERLHMMEGDFWTGSVCLGTAVTTDVMTLLGRAAGLLDKPWHTLDMSELELLISSVTAAGAFRFRINKMERIAAEARKILDCQDLMEQYENLKVELAEVKAELKDRLGGRDMKSTVRSVVDD